MRKSMMKILALLVALTLLATATGTSFATATPPSDTSNDKTRIQELMDCGLTQQQAEKLVRVEKISKQLEQNGQTLEMDGDKVVIKDSGKPIVVNITNDDKNFITNVVEKAAKIPKISEEKKMADIKEAMEQNPGRKKYRVVYDEDHWIERDLSTEALEIYTDNKVKAYGTYREQCVQAQYPYAGNYSSTNDMREYCGVSLADNWLNVTINFGPTNPVSECHITYARNGVQQGGLVNVCNCSKYINKADWYSYYGGYPAEAESQVVYSLAGSVGITLFGPMSFSVSPNFTWTEYAYIRGNYGLYKYDGVFE